VPPVPVAAQASADSITMNIKELIDILSQYPETMRVVVDGYEGGFEDINNLGRHSIYKIPVFLNKNPDDPYHGEHELCLNEDDIPDEIVISIGSRHISISRFPFYDDEDDEDN